MSELDDPTKVTEDNVRAMIGFLHRDGKAASADLLFNLWAAYSRVLLTRPQPLTFPQPAYWPMGPGLFGGFTGALPATLGKFDDGSAREAVDPCACPDCGSTDKIHECPADGETADACGHTFAANSGEYVCGLDKGHTGPHEDTVAEYTWPTAEYENAPPFVENPDKCPECLRLQRVERDWGLRCRDHLPAPNGIADPLGLARMALGRHDDDD